MSPENFQKSLELPLLAKTPSWEDNMATLRRRVKNPLERYRAYQTERCDNKSFALIKQMHKADRWFLYDALIRSIVEKLKIDLVIDVGANRGQFARNLRSFYRGEILSFEPVSSAFEQLAARASSDSNWHVHQYALGSHECTQTLNVSERTDFSSFLKANRYCGERFGVAALGTKEETVSVRRLDEVLDEIVPNIEGRLIFVKMDTQGYDIEVFKGLGNKVKQVMALQSEVSLISLYDGMPHWTECISTYESKGFGVAGMFPVTWDSWRVIEYDCILIKT